jgi:hypothetical protein
MEKEQILPILNTEVLQQKATEFAMLGAIKSIEEFYSSYNSPFRKQIDQQLSEQKIGSGIELPDIIALINESLTKEIDLIANTAVAKTFIPLVQKFLVREDKEIDFSEILIEFIKATEAEEFGDCEVFMEESKYGWLDVDLKYNTNEKVYQICLHPDRNNEEGKPKKYKILSLPRDYNSKEKYGGTMKLTINGGTLEMPFTKDVLHDDFTAYVARLVIGNCLITIDTEDFDEYMYDEV